MNLEEIYFPFSDKKKQIIENYNKYKNSEEFTLNKKNEICQMCKNTKDIIKFQNCHNFCGKCIEGYVRHMNNNQHNIENYKFQYSSVILSIIITNNLIIFLKSD